MKKFLCVLLFILVFSLSGCSMLIPEVLTDNNVETLKSWSFQYNEGTNDYSVFFALLNKSGKYIAADVDVDIRIEDETGEEIYKTTKSVTEDDFGYYTSQIAGEQYLANVRIPASEVAEGKSSNGTVYLTIHKENVIRFDEVNCSALYCLPVEDVQLNVETLPVDLKVKDFNGNTESTIQIDTVSFVFDRDYIPQLKITISGTKTYGSSNSGYDMIGYKLYDSADYMVNSGYVYLRSLSRGDKFKDDSIVIYDITPGETYTLKLMEYEW